jgi:O-antigen/teichoic acid export membrane protein
MISKLNIRIAASNVFRFKGFDLLRIEEAIVFSVMGKIWLIGSGLVTTLLIAKCFSPELQGYYYTFNAVLAFQIFAELGLTTVITSFASHEWSQISLDRNGEVHGDADAISRLASLGGFSFKWYLVAGTVMALVLIIGGFIFFGTRPSQNVNWQEPWIILCIVTGFNLFFMPIWALLEGCNQVTNIYKYRFVQYVVSSLAAWLSIYFDAGLWVASITGAAGLLAMMLLVGRRYRAFLITFFLHKPEGSRLRWREDILPMQWRIGLSWIGGYFTFALFTPVLFYYHGPVAAGQMGMTWAFVNALMTMAAAWTLPKAPMFGILIAQRKYAELDLAFWKLALTVLGLTIVGAVGIWLFVLLLNYLHYQLALRLLTPSTVAYLLFASIIYGVGLPMSTYLRAHKKEPLMTLSIAHGLSTAILVVILGKFYAANGVALGYLITTTIVTPFVALIWYRRRAEWHAHPVPGIAS